MSTKLNAGDYGRSDLFFIDPVNIVVDESANSRWMAHDKDSIERMMHSFEQHGQEQPVQVRRIDDKKVQLVMGYRRWLAANAFNKKHTDKPMRLQCKLVDINAEEAFIHSLVENLERKGTTLMDDAFNQRRLRDQHGWTNAKIAEFYTVTEGYVSSLRNLLMLPKDTQLMVHKGDLTLQAALSLAALPEDEQKEVLVESVAGVPEATPEADDFEPEPEHPKKTKKKQKEKAKRKKAVSANVVKKVREKKIEKGGQQSRSMKDMRVFFERLTGPGEKPGVKKLSEIVLKFLAGAVTEDTTEKNLNNLFS